MLVAALLRTQASHGWLPSSWPSCGQPSWPERSILTLAHYFNVLSNLSRTRAFSSGCSRIMTAGLWTTTYHISSTQSLLRRAGQVHPEPFRSCFRLEVWTLSSPVSCTRGVIAVPLNWGCVSPSLHCQRPSRAQVLIFNQELVCFVAIFILAASSFSSAVTQKDTPDFTLARARYCVVTWDDPSH